MLILRVKFTVSTVKAAVSRKLFLSLEVISKLYPWVNSSSWQWLPWIQKSPEVISRCNNNSNRFNYRCLPWVKGGAGMAHGPCICLCSLNPLQNQNQGSGLQPLCLLSSLADAVAKQCLFKDATARTRMTSKKEVKPYASWKHTLNTKKTSLQRGRRRLPSRNTARMSERVLAMWYLPVHSIFFALLKGKVKDNNSVLNIFRCFVTRGSCRKSEFSEMKKKEQKGTLCILLTVSYFTAFLKHLRHDLEKRGWVVDILSEDGFHIF